MNEENVERNDEIRIEITVSKFSLKEGDVLNQDIMYYDTLKKGVVLDRNSISVIQQINDIDQIKVLRLKKVIEEEMRQKIESNVKLVDERQEQVQTIDKISDVDVKLGFSDEKADRKIAEAIRKTFDKIRGEDYLDKVDETKEKIESILLTDQITSTTAKQEVQKTIKEISQSFVDTISLQKIVPLKSKADVIGVNFSSKSISNYFLDLVITDKVSFVNSAKSVVVKFINSFGDDNGGIVLSSLFQFSENDDYVVAHSIFVMSISILIAKELTKLVYEKVLSNSQGKLDPKVLKLVSLKIFDLEDLTNIGLASILHDVGLRKNFGTIPPSFKIPVANLSKIELHPSESSFFVQRLNLDVSIQRAIYEHHEFMDGSGYPKGITKYMSKYSPIIAFVERFSELVLENPFIQKPVPPAVAINYILKNELRKFDKDVVFAFVRATSTYPIGSWVELSNGTIGFVSNVSPKDRTKQIVKLIFTSNLTKLNQQMLIDLAEREDLKIIKVINPIELSQKVGDLRGYYFD